MSAVDSNKTNKKALDTLSDDVLFAILNYLDVKTLLVLARVSRNLNRVASADAVWRKIASRCVNIRTSRRCNVSWKSQCRVSYNWINGRCRDMPLMKFRFNLMPCIQLAEVPQHLYVSRGADIIQLRKPKHSRGSAWQQQLVLKGHQGDVCRFVVKSRQLVSCGDDRTVQVWDLDSGRHEGVYCGHTDRVNCVDHDGDVIVSGSRDKVFVSGSSGHSTEVPALQLWDVDSSQVVNQLQTGDPRPGAGVRAVKWETPFALLSCGYDAILRLWDTRIVNGICQEWEDPDDSTVYCVDSDDKWMIVSGTNRYGVSFYVGRNCRSPVYSLRADHTNLFVALANGLRRLDFSV